MSLRDFNASDDRPISLHNQAPGNESGLGAFHTVQPEDAEPSNTPKIVGALAVALMIGVAGFGLYQANSGSSSQPKPVVTASNMPAPAAPIASDAQQSAQAAKAAKAATTDPNSLRAALVKTPAASADNTAVPAPAKTASAKPARSHAAANNDTGAASARMSADQTIQAPAQQAIATPAPASPSAPSPSAPSPSDVASNNNQSSVAVPSDATRASDIPAPAPQEQPAPAQPSPAQ